MKATGLIYKAAGKPEIPATVSGVCRACALAGEGVLFSGWVRETFTDYASLFEGSIVCRACLFCFDEQSEILRIKTGKEKLQRMRSYSHFVAAGEWFALSKAQKTEIYELLLAQPEVAVIAESGQKHLIFKTRQGWWNFEGAQILPFPEKLKFLYEAAFRLYELGVTKDEIESGRYSARSFRHGIERVLEMDAPLKPARGSIQLQLAIYLMQKEKDDE